MEKAHSELILRTMCNTIPDMIWSKDVNGIYTFVNQAICDRLLSAKDTDEPIGKDDMFFALRERNLHKDNPQWHTFGELCYDSDAVTIEAEEPRQFFEYGNIKGTFLYLDVRKAPLRDESGKIIGVVGSARDITKERLRDLELIKLSQAINHAGESFMITNRDGTIEYVNPAFTKITGYTAEEAIGENPRILKSGKQAPEYYERLWKTISGGDVWHSSVIDCRKDGTQYPAIMSIAPIFDHDHQITHYVGIQQDMSEHKAMEEKFLQAQKMEAMGTLVGGIAHDFNNMLAGMTGNLYLAKKRSSDNPDVVKKIENVEKLSFQASDMIKQLLTFARKGILEVKPFGLTSFVKEVSKLCESSVPENITFTQQVCCKELVIKGDVSQLQQVLFNLINNARDAVSNILDPEVSLILSEFEADDKFRVAHSNVGGKLFAHLTVHDNGVGIRKKDIKRIFEPFYTTKEVGAGTGLGLPMVYGAIQSHGGAIDIVSKEGEGTVFNIYLPLIEERNVNIAPDTHTEKPLMGNGELILLVDDEEKIRSTGKEVLESLGYSVIEASNGLKAYDLFLLNQMDVSLIIMDVVMPILGGVEAVERIRVIRPDINIIYATGYDKDESLKSEMPVDGSIILSKPYHITTLSKIMRNLLDAK